MEICVDNIQSALIAEKYGASRIELCSALDSEGLTPNLGMFKILRSVMKIPIFIMIRPRKGNFNYDHLEYGSMKDDILTFKENNAEGFVFGILMENDEIDVERNRKLVEIAYPCPVTFHRAFDMVKDPLDSVTIVYKIGFTRVLSSGCRENVSQGINMISKLIEKCHELSLCDNNRELIIMPGGGITTKNLKNVIIETKCKEFHSSCVKKTIDNGNSFSSTNQSSFSLPDPNIIKEMLNIAKECKMCV